MQTKNNNLVLKSGLSSFLINGFLMTMFCFVTFKMDIANESDEAMFWFKIVMAIVLLVTGLYLLSQSHKLLIFTNTSVSLKIPFSITSFFKSNEHSFDLNEVKEINFRNHYKGPDSLTIVCREETYDFVYFLPTINKVKAIQTIKVFLLDNGLDIKVSY